MNSSVSNTGAQKGNARIRSGSLIRPAWLIAAIAVLGIAAAGCFPKTGTYPIEIFTEMHYSQAFRSQEPPRLDAVRGAEVFVGLGTEETLALTLTQEREYVPAVASDLYAVNCSVCHGAGGRGDGPVAIFLTTPELTKDGVAYGAPPDLHKSRERLARDVLFGIVSSGINVMPRFELLLSEEDRWDIVNYVFDTETGLGSQ
ncbi:MAG: cytochrome c [Chloroflexi bacterium]|nr:cytochrome c [Chloroflexota bacterium]